MMTKKVIIGGPARSGKSCFLRGLKGALPRDMHYLFRACPDGEGSWTYRGNGSERYRIKGSFSKENVSWYVRSLQDCGRSFSPHSALR